MRYWVFFPYMIASLELCAALVHLYARNYRMAIIWAGVSVSNFAFAEMR